MADARDLKSLVPKGMCGFESRRRQFFMCLSRNVLNRQSSRNQLHFRAVFGQLAYVSCAMPSKTKSEKEFPLTVKAGSTAVKIYRDRKRSGDYFRLVYYLGGKRHRLNFSSLDAAKEEALAKAAQLARGDVDAVQLNGRDRLTYGRALDAIKSTGVALDAAATEYAQAAKTLAGHSLLDAVNFYMRHGVNGVSGRMVSDAVDDFRQAKTGAGRSAVYLKDIRYRLGGFAKAFNLEVRELVAQDVADYLEGLKLHSRSFNNHLSMLRTFFRFCQARGWLSKHADLLSRVERRSAIGFRYRDLHARGIARPSRGGSPARGDMPRHPGVRRRAHRGTLSAYMA